MENWMLIPQNNNYIVSDHGNIKRIIGTPCHPVSPRNLKLTMNSRHGYYQVSLCGNGGVKKCNVHVLVASAFLGPRPDGKPQKFPINHKDGIKTNNHVSNLEYVTCSENGLHAARVMGQRKGVRNGMARLTEGQVREIRRMRPCDAARKFNIHYQHAFAIRKRTIWAHLQ